MGLFAPYFAPHDPLLPNLNEKFAPWSTNYPLGSDHLGRCIASRLIFAIRTTFFLAIFAMFITILLGLVCGLLASFFKRLETPILRLCDLMLSFPSELMMLAIVGILGAGIENIIIANIISKVPWHTRMIYTFCLKYKNENFILYSKVLGTPSYLILKNHLLPLILCDIALLATLNIGGVILSISALSFLGLGIQAPTPEWGMMLNEAKNVMSIAPLQMVAPGLTILIIVVIFNFLGDSIRDTLDPKFYKKERV